MKKEQLKERIGELNLVDTVFEADGVSYIDTVVSVMQVYDLIDQLDEPEKVVVGEVSGMNKQELIKNIKSLAREGSQQYPHEEMVELPDVLREIDQLDEPEKAEPLVVPKDLGELLVGIPLGEKTMLIPMIEDLREFHSETFERDRRDLYYFIADNTKQLIEVIIGNRGYEVEKEQLYYVLNKQGETLLVLIGGAVCLSSGYALRDGNKDKYQLTKKQIKDYDERYWAFAVEVEE